MWAWSRNSDLGSATEAAAMFESPGRGLRIALNFGWAPRLVPPKRRKERRGLKPRFSQPAAWKWFETLAVAPSAPLTNASTEEGSQLVGAAVKFGRSRATLMSLTFKAMPWSESGIGSDTALTWAVVGST